MKWFKRAAKQGDFHAQANLGVMYYKGRGVKQNYAEAMRWYKMAADQGYVDAIDEVGAMYHDGQGVEKDKIKAFAYWSVALTLNHDKVANTNLLVSLTEMNLEEIKEARQQAAVLLDDILARQNRNNSKILRSQ
jgi:TPR repeat protein